MKRVATYCFYDKNGVVARYKLFYLSQLVHFVDRLVIVCNGTLRPEGLAALKPFSDDILIRENKGFDFWAHKAGLEHIGWDALQEYDEYVLCNDTCYGPIYPFDALFEEMGKRDCDFWGVMVNFEDKDAIAHGNVKYPGGHCKDFLVSSFLAVTSRLLHSAEFRQFWDELKPITSYSEDVVYGEYQFTAFFEGKGYQWAAYQSNALKGLVQSAHANAPDWLIEENQIPLLRKKVVNGSLPLSQAWDYGYGDEAYQALEYIQKHTAYDAQLIWEDILRSSHLSSIQERLQLKWCIPDQSMDRPYAYNQKIAVICHIANEKLVAECAAYSENFPSSTDFFLTAPSEDILAEIQREYGKRGMHPQVLILPENADEGLGLFKPYAHVVTGGSYEYICCFHGCMPSPPHGGVHLQTKRRCYQALFGTPDTVRNILHTFMDSPSLGILTSPPAYHNGFFLAQPTLWKENFEKIQLLADWFSIDVPLRADVCEPSAYEGQFWFRADALAKMVARGLPDSTETDAAKRKAYEETAGALSQMYGIAAQDSGYFTAYALSTTQARSELSNGQAMLFGTDGIGSIITDSIANSTGRYSHFIHTLKINLAWLRRIQGGSETHSVNPRFYDDVNLFLQPISTQMLLKQLAKRALRAITPRGLWQKLVRWRHATHDGRE